MAKKIRSASTAGSNRAYSNGGGGKDKCSDGMPQSESRMGSIKPICHGYRQGKSELLQLQKIWTFSVVTTTYPMINDSTINKSQVRILCGKFTRELNKESLLN